MPSGAMNRLFVESSSSSSSGSGGCREEEPAAAVLCAPRPRRVQVHPCSADLILGPPPFMLGTNKVLTGSKSLTSTPVLACLANNFPSFAASCCSCSCCLTKICSFSLLSSQSKEAGGKAKAPEADEDGGWALFGGSPPARADNPLVHDPHFILNQRHPVAASPLELGFFDHQSRSNHSHRPTYISSHSSSNSFAPTFAPAVRIQGFDVAACRSSHSNGGGRVLSARA